MSKNLKYLLKGEPLRVRIYTHLYSLAIKLHLIRFDTYEEHHSDYKALVVEPRWVWQRKADGT